MKSRAIAILVFASFVCAGFAAPAFAQNAQVEAEYQHYLNAHPELRANPSLINDPAYLANHQGLVHWLNQHPNMRNQVMWMGAYDNNHRWHNADWWHRNDPDWMYEHHPEWVRANPAWQNDGDWDDQHRWHDRDWWLDHHREWVEQHHPNWAKYEEHHNPNWGAEQQHSNQNWGAENKQHGNGNAYGHDKDHGDHGHGHGHHDND